MFWQTSIRNCFNCKKTPGLIRLNHVDGEICVILFCFLFLTDCGHTTMTLEKWRLMCTVVFYTCLWIEKQRKEYFRWYRSNQKKPMKERRSNLTNVNECKTWNLIWNKNEKNWNLSLKSLNFVFQEGLKKEVDANDVQDDCCFVNTNQLLLSWFYSWLVENNLDKSLSHILHENFRETKSFFFSLDLKSCQTIR